MLNFAPVVHVLPVTLVQRKRLLPVTGKVMARKGQKVTAAEVVAQADLTSEHVLLDVARGLGVAEAEADQYIHRQPGDEVAVGDIIAGPVGLARRVVRATQPGQVILAGSGQVLLQLEGRPFEVRAGISGVVTELYPDQGVQVETVGALVQGVWGNGWVDSGLLTVIIKSAEEELTPDRLDISLRGGVVLGGYCGDERVLYDAQEQQLRGLILASMSSALVPVALKMTFPIIILDGFGRLPMNRLAFRLLSTSGRREAVVNAVQWDRLSGNRPEVVLPLPPSAQPMESSDTIQFAPDLDVRIIHGPHLGEAGILNRLLGVVTLPSGLRAQAAEVQLENDESLVLPLANLEVMK
jgi:hypothetical protein